ncbi:MAG: carbohydrate ABC transporter permease [Chloroflexi bacterium]|jgi:multiple sugar transport system permease protein|nr:MAG: ABC transporter permease [Chloroflexi bacterium OLB13]MBC6956017.1 carbohydrate ABC transporter permease [Chloroflexota bacterium]MBV6435361.1 L-arabinose transport system permease protein AraQ [Anaerolineae bacterium]MDL1915646.1 carbohydrate ABC transporter permease [Anaerolineae bacterium CFX4]OQY84836.1 MAG: ABC transporter permease [Anaerolineae bacterium UTCFX5]
MSYRLRHLPAYAFLIVMSIFVVMPLLIAISQSLMTNAEVNRWPPQIIPANPTFENMHQVLTQQDLRIDLWLRNSLLAASGYTIAVLVLCAPAAYAFARLRFPGNNILFGLLLVTIMIPSQVTLIPNYLLMRDLKWLDTFNALIFPGAANVFGVFLLRQFFMSIPSELEEAAVLDGAGYFGRFWYVVLPLSTNALVALSIFIFLGHYNDLFWPFIVTNSLETRTLPVGLTILNSSYAGQYRPMVLSGAVLSTIPILIVYVLFQRRIIRGVMLTGMAGR